MKEKLKSRKLWLTVLGGAVVAAMAPAALPAYLQWAIPTYVVSEGARDAMAALAAARAAKVAGSK